MRTFLRFLWMALVLVIVALISALTAMRFAIHGREVSVPDLQGKSPAEARRIAAESEVHPGADVVLRINPEVAEILRGDEKRVLSEIEAYFGCSITIKGDPTVHQERFDFAIM